MTLISSDSLTSIGSSDRSIASSTVLKKALFVVACESLDGLPRLLDAAEPELELENTELVLLLLLLCKLVADFELLNKPALTEAAEAIEAAWLDAEKTEVPETASLCKSLAIL